MTIHVNENDTLDAVLKAAPPGADIYLEEGVYRTDGRMEIEGTEPLIKPRQRIHGAGQGRTIIELNRTNPDRLTGIFLGLYNELVHDVLIEGICFDLNMDQESVGACSAIGVRGWNVEVRDCQFINWGNKSDKFESFVVSLGAPWERLCGYGNRILRCQAFSPMPNSMGGATTVFCIGGGTSTGGYRAVIEDSSIEDCSVVSDAFTSMVHGYQISASRGCFVQSCYGRNLEFGVYHDTWRNDSMIVRNCFFNNCKSGMFFNLGGVVNGDLASEGLLVLANNVIVSPNEPKQCGIAMWGNGTAPILCDTFIADGNVIVNGPGSMPAKSGALQLYAYRCKEAIFRNNTVHPIPGASYPIVMGNQCGSIQASGNSPKAINYVTKQEIG